jgi:hypothetical protein
MLPEVVPEHTGGILKIYDLGDPASEEQAHQECAAWGRQWVKIYHLDSDHVAIEFKPAGARGAAA